ncbi:MAG: spondin domain-containing protein [Gammaproteobacteria bacterium]|nr:spondin domain-containing protein [Gammaproteobacteria bacterium]
MILQACDGSGNLVNAPNPVVPPPPPPPPAMASFDVTVINLTNAQPLSPAAVIGHQDGYSVFTVGTAATAGLEQMAEGGDNTALLAEATADANVLASSSGAAPIGPAGSETITIEVLESDVANLRMSIATMLVNTNDAFSAVNGMSFAGMAVGDSMTLDTIAYDAGTEADSEEAIHIPGPAGGGEGFNAARDDEGDRVSMHSGVVSGEDGFASSDLTGQHRFDNPVMRVRIARTQ